MIPLPRLAKTSQHMNNVNQIFVFELNESQARSCYWYHLLTLTMSARLNIVVVHNDRFCFSLRQDFRQPVHDVDFLLGLGIGHPLDVFAQGYSM